MTTQKKATKKKVKKSSKPQVCVETDKGRVCFEGSIQALSMIVDGIAMGVRITSISLLTTSKSKRK